MKKIAVFTSARSEYGPLKPLLEQLKTHPRFKLDLLVGGGHFSHEQGNTVNEIIKDGFEISYQLPFLINDPKPTFVSRSNGLLAMQICDYFDQHQPDLLLVLGDRSELIPVVSSALFQSIPIAHISGGEVTEGASDNQVRHAVTKMSHIHFPATELYKENIIKMGEEEWRICVSGEPSLDAVKKIALPSQNDFFTQYNLDSNQEFVLATIHSETINQSINPTFIEDLVGQLLLKTNFQYLFTAANTDIGGIEINKTLEALAKKYDRVKFVRSLGKTNYYAALKYAKLVLGNSSSGIIEAQSFQVPVLNIGSRQDGRLRNPNVFDVSLNTSAILNAMLEAQTSTFTQKFNGKANIYGDGNASEKIIKFIENINWEALLLKKSTL